MLFISQFNVQILDQYPRGQRFYEGAILQFYKESIEFLVKNKIEECNFKEILVLPFCHKILYLCKFNLFKNKIYSFKFQL